MTSLLIIAVMITVLLGATAYALLNASAGLSSQIDRATTATRLEQAAQGVLANIVTIPSASSNYYAVPAPDSTTTSNIPSWIMANAFNSKGIPFLYCPYTNNNAATSGTITVPSGTYGVTIATLYTGSKNFVTISAARPALAPAALAIIVAPGENATAAGDCTTLSATGTISGNSVRVITEADVFARDTINASSGNQFYVGTAASGDGSGRNSSNQVALSDVLTYNGQYLPQYMRLNLAGSTFTTTTAALSETNVTARPLSSARQHVLDMIGAGSGSTILRSASNVPAQFIGNVSFKDMAITAASAANTVSPVARGMTKIFTDNSIIHYFKLETGGELYALNTTSLYGNASGDQIYIYYGGKFYSDAAFNMPTGAALNSGYWRVEAGQVIFGSNSNVTFNDTTGSTLIWTYSLSDYYFMNIVQNINTSSTSAITGATVNTQFVASGATISNFRGTSFVFSNAGRYIVDRGSSYLTTNSTSYPVNHYLYLGAGAEVFLTNSTFGSVGNTSQRPTWRTIIIFKDATNLGPIGIYGGTNGGWPVANTTAKTTGSNCWEPQSPDIFANTRTGNGYYSPSIGHGGYEPWSIANRSNWYCNM